jgi:hypothetical protein
MLRIVIYAVVIATLVVVLRLLFVRPRVQERERTSSPKPSIIEMPPRAQLEIKHYFFANLDKSIGPPDPQHFLENLVVHVGPEGSDRYRVFSLWVGTPGAAAPGTQAYRFGRGLLLVERYDLELIVKAVRQHINELGLLAEEVG